MFDEDRTKVAGLGSVPPAVEIKLDGDDDDKTDIVDAYDEGVPPLDDDDVESVGVGGIVGGIVDGIVGVGSVEEDVGGLPGRLCVSLVGVTLLMITIDPKVVGAGLRCNGLVKEKGRSVLVTTIVFPVHVTKSDNCEQTTLSHLLSK
jgi:hypothetical protein